MESRSASSVRRSRQAPWSLSSVLSRFIDAACGVAPWAEALQAGADWVGADGYHLLIWDARRNASGFAVVSEDFAGSALHQYNAHYGACDPRRSAMAEGDGRLFLCQKRFSEQFVSRSEFYQDFLRPHGVRYLAGSALSMGVSRSIIIALLRSPGLGPFQARYTRRLREFVPEALRLAALARRYDELEAQRALHSSVNDLSPAGRLVLDRHMETIAVNRAARNMLRSIGVDSIANKCLRFDSRKVKAVFKDVLSAVFNEGRSVQALLESDIRLEPSGRRIFVSACPMSAAVRTTFQGPLALIRLMPEAPTLSSSPAAALFGLSSTECRLADALLAGMRAEDYAARNHVKITTVRTHIRSLLNKTNTTRQSDFIRLLTALSQLAHD